MSFILTSRTRQRQPTDPAVRASSWWVSKGMKLIASGGEPMINAVRQSVMPIAKSSAISIGERSAGYGVARFSRGFDCDVDTGVVTGAGAVHSGVLLVRHRNLSAAADEAYFCSRVSANNGFLFYLKNAYGSAPNRTFNLGYVHGGVAVATSSGSISGGDDQFVTVGFSANTATGAVDYYGNGLSVGSASDASIMSASTDSVRIGRDVTFNQFTANYDLAAVAYGHVFLTGREHFELARSMWQLFAPERTPVFYSIAGVPPGPSTANRIMLLRRPGLSRIWR